MEVFLLTCFALKNTNLGAAIDYDKMTKRQRREFIQAALSDYLLRRLQELEYRLRKGLPPDQKTRRG